MFKLTNICFTFQIHQSNHYLLTNDNLLQLSPLQHTIYEITVPVGVIGNNLQPTCESSATAFYQIISSLFL